MNIFPVKKGTIIKSKGGFILYRVIEDNNEKQIILFETNNFIEAIKKAKTLSMQKVNRVFIYSDAVNSDMCIIFDPIGKQTIL